MMDISIPYYEDNTRVSNSSIGYFLESPMYFKQKMDGTIANEESSAMAHGTMIHEYILQPDEFNKDYVLCPEDIQVPQSGQQRSFCKLVAESLEIEPLRAFVSAYKATYSIVGKSEDKIASEATKMGTTLKSYIDLLKDGRTIMPKYMFNKCEKLRNNILEHKFASKLLNRKDVEEHHEFHINWEYNGVPCKSLLDCVQFDYENKECTIIDLKTTVKINHFEESIKKYDYMRQLCFYSLAAEWYLMNEKNVNMDEWTFKFYIVALDSGYDSFVRVFRFDYINILQRDATIHKAICDIKWHKENNLWEHSREYYEGDGCEKLNLEF